MIVLPFLGVTLVCSLPDQDCPAGQYCNAVWEEDGKTCPKDGKCEPLPESPALELSLPIPAGERVFCGKGNLKHGGSHNPCALNTRFAFDFVSFAWEAPHVVVAAADGTAYPFGGCSSMDLNRPLSSQDCNGGWGNLIKIDHGEEVYTQYAHLSAVMVSWGQPVKRGQPIGIEGNTGASGPKHLHFSLHRGEASELSTTASLPINKLRVKGKAMRWNELKCGEWSIPGAGHGAAYTSETAVTKMPEQFGFTPDWKAISKLALSSKNDDRRAAILTLKQFPYDVEAQYWLGVALQTDAKIEDARRTLGAVLAFDNPPPWVRAWCELRLGELSAAVGQKKEAKKWLEAAKAHTPPGDRDFEDRLKIRLETIK